MQEVFEQADASWQLLPKLLMEMPDTTNLDSLTTSFVQLVESAAVSIIPEHLPELWQDFADKCGVDMETPAKFSVEFAKYLQGSLQAKTDEVMTTVELYLDFAWNQQKLLDHIIPTLILHERVNLWRVKGFLTPFAAVLHDSRSGKGILHDVVGRLLTGLMAPQADDGEEARRATVLLEKIVTESWLRQRSPDGIPKAPATWVQSWLTKMLPQFNSMLYSLEHSVDDVNVLKVADTIVNQFVYYKSPLTPKIKLDIIFLYQSEGAGAVIDAMQRFLGMWRRVFDLLRSSIEVGLGNRPPSRRIRGIVSVNLIELN